MAQLMPLPLTVSCFSKTQIDFTFLVQADPGSPGKIVCACVRACVRACVCGMRRLPTPLTKRLSVCAVTDSTELHVYNAPRQQPDSCKDVRGLSDLSLYCTVKPA